MTTRQPLDAAEITRLTAERDELARQVHGLAAWQCQECGARFSETVAPAVLVGVVRCSTCVERHEALADRADALALLRRLRPLTVEMPAMQAEIDALLKETP